MFLSRAFGGQATDTEMTTQRGLTDYLEQGDAILSDKGFPTAESDINSAGGFLVMPPFRSGNMQFFREQNKLTYQCASV